MNEQTIKTRINEYLENGEFDVSDYAALEFSGLTAMLAEDWPQERIEESLMPWIKNKNDLYSVYDGLGEYAHEKAIAEELKPGIDYR